MAKTRQITKHSARSGQGEIRIIGGDWRGRKLPVLQSEGLRPTSDRVRETVFNWLQFSVPGASCLDVYAGSGALAFEALSRGAKSAVLLELNPQTAKQLQRNLQTLNANRAVVETTDSLQWLSSQATETFDIVFIDPPFHKDLMQHSVDRLFEHGFISDTTWLYLEQETQLDWPNLPQGWHCHREKKTSQVRFGLFCLEPH